MQAASLPTPLRLAIRPLLRAPRRAIGSILILVAGTLCLELVLAVPMLGARLGGSLADALALPVELQAGAQETSVSALSDEIRRLPGVRTAKFVSRDEALRDFQARHPDLADTLGTLTFTNPLPPLLLVVTDAPADQDAVIAALRISANANVSVDPTWLAAAEPTRVPEAERLQTRLRLGALGGSALFAAVTAILALAAAHHARREDAAETAILRIVGADQMTRVRITALRGLILGGIAGLAALTVSGFTAVVLGPILALQLGIEVGTAIPAVLLGAVAIGGGMILGAGTTVRVR